MHWTTNKQPIHSGHCRRFSKKAKPNAAKHAVHSSIPSTKEPETVIASSFLLEDPATQLLFFPRARRLLVIIECLALRKRCHSFSWSPQKPLEVLLFRHFSQSQAFLHRGGRLLVVIACAKLSTRGIVNLYRHYTRCSRICHSCASKTTHSFRFTKGRFVLLGLECVRHFIRKKGLARQLYSSYRVV